MTASVLMLTAAMPAARFTATAEMEWSSDSQNHKTAVKVDPVGHSEECCAVVYNNTNGLPTSEANAIAETSEGFIWIGSYSGLIRYDGNSFERLA